MKLKLFLLCSLLILTGCTNSRTKAIVRDNHVISQVIAKRVDDPDEKKRPTYDELAQFIKTTAFSWQEMDKLVNGWKPTVATPDSPLTLQPRNYVERVVTYEMRGKQ